MTIINQTKDAAVNYDNVLVVSQTGCVVSAIMTNGRNVLLGAYETEEDANDVFCTIFEDMCNKSAPFNQIFLMPE